MTAIATVSITKKNINIFSFKYLRVSNDIYKNSLLILFIYLFFPLSSATFFYVCLYELFRTPLI